MLQRYFFIILVACLFSACQNSDNTDTATSANGTGTENTEVEGNTSQIKTLREAAKEQNLATRTKTTKAKKEQEKIRLDEKSESKINHNEKQKTAGSQTTVSGESTKTRILRNLSQNQQKGKDRGAEDPAPSQGFIKATRSLADINLRIAKLGKKPLEGYQSYTKVVPVDEYYAYTSHDNTWGGPFTKEGQKEEAEVILKEVNVFEAVFKSTELEKGLRPDVKVTEIQFKDKAAAEAAIPTIELISNAISENPKHLNTFWQDDNRFYIIETRAASFKDVYERANKVLYFTVTSSK